MAGATGEPPFYYAAAFEAFDAMRALVRYGNVDVDVKSLGGAASLNPEDWPENADTAPRIGRRVSLTMRQVVNLTRSLSFLTGR